MIKQASAKKIVRTALENILAADLQIDMKSITQATKMKVETFMYCFRIIWFLDGHEYRLSGYCFAANIQLVFMDIKMNQTKKDIFINEEAFSREAKEFIIMNLYEEEEKPEKVESK